MELRNPADCHTPARVVCEAALGLLAEALAGVRVTGLERVPREGPLIVACNHASMFDPPLLGWALHERRRPRFLAKKELFDWPVLGPLFPASGCIPLERRGSDRAALRAALAALAAGSSVAIFPEGTRVRPGERRPPKPGVGFLAAGSGAPVLPARVLGTPGWSAGRPYEVRFGALLPPPPKGTDPGDYAAAVMDAAYAL